MTHNLEDLLIDMFVDATNPLPGTQFTSFYLTNKPVESHPTEAFYDHVMSLNYSADSWKTQYYKTFGRCYSYNVPEWIKKQRIMDVTLRLSMTSVVFLHHRGQFHSQDSDTKVKAKLGEKLFIDTNHQVI